MSLGGRYNARMTVSDRLRLDLPHRFFKLEVVRVLRFKIRCLGHFHAVDVFRLYGHIILLELSIPQLLVLVVLVLGLLLVRKSAFILSFHFFGCYCFGF